VTHRRITVQPGENNRDAGFSARVRLIDTATKNVIWESSDQAMGVDPNLSDAAEDVTDALTKQLTEDAMKKKL
jgi:hypothetical protein